MTLVDLLAAGGARVVWVPFLPSDASPADQHDADATNTAVRSVAARDDRVEVLTLPAAVTSTADGWVSGSDGWHQARSTDGIHLCPWGAEQVAVALATQIDPIGTRRLGPGQQHGAWWATLPYTRAATGTTPVCNNDPLAAHPQAGR